MFITIENLVKKYYDKIILDHANYVINSGDKIGVIGVNGTGKSTLLKMIAGRTDIDDGKINGTNQLKISYLAQEQDFNEEKSIRDVAVNEVLKKNSLINEYEIVAMLNKLGINDTALKIKSLSGGQKKRVALAITLLEKSDLLILDEPTNHLDHEMIIWLEQYLQKYSKTLLMVTHDRYFLDRVTNKIMEIENTKIYNHDTNYSGYLERKVEREQMALASERKLNTIIRKEKEWMAQGIKARGTRSKKRVERFNEMLDVDKIQQKDSLNLEGYVSRMGNKTIEVKSITKEYANRPIIKDFTYQFQRFDRIGIVGNNGTGKSTLLNLITQEIIPDSGTIEIGETIKIGYYKQDPVELDNNMRIIDFVETFATEIAMPSGTLSASQLLENFLFDRKKQYQYIKHLSGGEKRRLYLLTILITAPNVLILDEPTNDLDIETLTILEDFLDEYPGIIITVSHDRYFLDKVVDKIFEVAEGGQVKIFNQGYSEYFEEIAIKEPEVKEQLKVEKTKKNNGSTLKFSYKEKHEFATIDDDIAKLETELEQIDAAIMEHAADFTKLTELTAIRQTKEEELMQKTDRWFYLNDLNDKINGAKND